MKGSVTLSRQKNNNHKPMMAILIMIIVILFVTIGSSIARHNSDGIVEDISIQSADENIDSEVLYDSPKNQSRIESSPIPESADSNVSQAAPSSQINDTAAIESQRLDLHSIVPEVPGNQAYVEVNDNIPLFTDEDIINESTAWESYGELDSMGRVTAAEANLGAELMPASETERENLQNITPTGWQQAQYDTIKSGGWLYNRSHLIGYQLTGEQDNLNNLMTGTRHFNTEGMLPFENYVADYIESNAVHVRYRVTPLFLEQELLARGVFMEGYSLEDDGGLSFHIFVPNIQPGIAIDYETGNSQIQ